MPKARSTCTRCSMRRQKCDRQNPCGRCVSSKEAHLCTTKWPNGYNPKIHRQYPSKGISPNRAITRSSPKDGAQNCTSNPVTVHDIGLPQEPLPASNNLDFITQGRSEYTDISLGGIMFSKDTVLKEQTTSQNQCIPRGDDTKTSGFSPAARAVEIFHLKSLFPTKEQVLQMVNYHMRYMLCWSSGGIYHGPSFKESVLLSYGQSNELDVQNLDWRWTALLFSVLSASIIASPDQLSISWGYPSSDKVRLAKQWSNATKSCLQLGEYGTKYHTYSIQAILNLHASEHLVGSAKEWLFYQTSALVIARGLGLHRLGPHPEDAESETLHSEQREALIQREIGRRIWYALVSQDWLCSNSMGLYSIQKKHFTSIKPGSYDDDTMTLVSDGTPSAAEAGNYLNEIGYQLVCYLDDMLSATDLASKYEVVLRHDGRMRESAADRMPDFLSSTKPYNPAWPRWVLWTRPIFEASCAHKIIVIHQAFLSRSFKHPQYTYSRWACCNAAKTIIKALCHERYPEEPEWWVAQAMLVTAGVCLTLDVFHRTDKETETQEHLGYIQMVIKALDESTTSSVAAYGNRLLNSLLHEYNKKFNMARPDTASSTTRPALSENIAPARDSQASRGTQPELVVTQPEMPPDPWLTGWGDVDMAGFGNFMDTFPLEAGLDNNIFFEDMLGLANTQF